MLCQRAIPVVESAYASALADPLNGNSDVILSATKTPDGATLNAMGESVVFLEFGAGVGTASAYVSADAEGLPPIVPGSWSKDHKKEFVNKGYWHYNGEKISSVRPSLGLYNGKKFMQTELAKVLKEITK